MKTIFLIAVLTLGAGQAALADDPCLCGCTFTGVGPNGFIDFGIDLMKSQNKTCNELRCIDEAPKHGIYDWTTLDVSPYYCGDGDQ